MKKICILCALFCGGCRYESTYPLFNPDFGDKLPVEFTEATCVSDTAKDPLVYEVKKTDLSLAARYQFRSISEQEWFPATFHKVTPSIYVVMTIDRTHKKYFYDLAKIEGTSYTLLAFDEAVEQRLGK